MSRVSVGAIAVTIAVSSAFSPSRAAAQVYIGRGRGVVVNAPGVTVRVGPFGAGVGVYPWRAQPTAPQTTPTSRPSQPPLPTVDELARLSDIELLNAIVSLSARLDDDLGRFTSATSWRRHLRLPDEALPPARNGQVTVGRRALIETLNRFDAAAANPDYRQISGVPSFRAQRAALAEGVQRFGAGPPSERANSPRSVEPTTPAAAEEPAAEELPKPPPFPTPPALPTPPQDAPESERSILSQ